MFNGKTVFVLGAGASSEIGLPVGPKLAEIISERVNIRFEFGHRELPGGDWRLYNLLKQKFPGKNQEYQKAGWAIRDGVLLANSIDDFLDRHSNNEAIVRYGKMAIVASILEGERKSRLFVDRNRKDEPFVSKIQDSWYPRLMKMMGAGVSAENIDQLFNNVAFIDFNYDRCLQQFLTLALQPLYGIDEARAREVVSKARILHPYGSVGNLPGMGEAPAVPFGDPDENSDLFHLSDQIRIYTEQVGDHGVVDQIRTTVASAKAIVFLGYAYHPQNMTLIAPVDSKNAQAIFGTAYKMSRADCAIVSNSLVGLMGPLPSRLNSDGRSKTVAEYIELRNDLTCAQLFDEYSRALPARR